MRIQSFLTLILILIAFLSLSNACKKPDNKPILTTDTTSLIGKWSETGVNFSRTLTFNSDSTYAAANNGKVFEQGNYSLLGTNLIFRAILSDPDCNRSGQYTITLKQNTLSFKLLYDSCSTREFGIGQSNPWEKQ